MIISRTPFRISFVGGGTDYPQWFEQYGGAVIAATINHYCYISCRHLPPFFDHKYRIAYSVIENVKRLEDIQHPAVRAILNYLDCQTGLEIHHDADLPARSGLGSSSSFTVGLVNAIKALRGQYSDVETLAKLAIHIEQNVIKEAVGSQDQILAAYGGFNRVDFLQGGGFKVTPLIISNERLDAFQRHLMLYFTGFSRFAPEVAQSKIDNFGKKYNELMTMRQMVEEALAILQNEQTDLLQFGKLLDRAWQYKRGLSAKVSTPEIDAIYEKALRAGATGGKLLGAGGGGFILLFAEPEKQAQIQVALSSLIHVPFRFENQGSRIVLYQPNGLALV
ncbi:MAG: kinase [Gammaproteobacteria bacterium]|nr:kinase [Gammaproteobacteria bacterium]